MDAHQVFSDHPDDHPHLGGGDTPDVVTPADATDAVPNEPAVRPELSSLYWRLFHRDVNAELTNDRLIVRRDGDPQTSITLVCRQRTDDGNRLGFLTNDGKPVAEADGEHTCEALTAISRLLSGD